MDNDPEEPVETWPDDLAQEQQRIASEFVVNYEDEALLRKLPQAIQHRFSESKHRKVTYHLKALTRYREYFSTILPTPGKEEVIHDPPTNAGAENIFDPARTAGWAYDHHRWGSIYRFHKERCSASRSRKSPIPFRSCPGNAKKSSAPTPLGNTVEVVEHRRIGGALRVYFKRPWFLSGEGELLGVVCLNPEYAMEKLFHEDFKVKELTKPEPGPPLPSNTEGILLKATRWAKDPINYQLYKLDRYPTIRDFYQYEAVKKGLVLQGDVGGLYDVIGYPVHYDQERNLLYSDLFIHIPEGQYFPFFRLCFARFQPESLAEGDRTIVGTAAYDHHISEIVPAEFIQVLPDRKCHYLIYPKAKNVIAVHMRGPVPFANYPVRVRNFVTMQVEEKIGTEGKEHYLLDPTETRIFRFNPAPEGFLPVPKDQFFHHRDGAGDYFVLYPIDPQTGKPGSPLIQLSDKYKVRPYRITLTEWEVREIDPPPFGQRASTARGDRLFTRSMVMIPKVYGNRIVFADSLEIDGEAGEFPGKICWQTIGQSKSACAPILSPWAIKETLAFSPNRDGYLRRKHNRLGQWSNWAFVSSMKRIHPDARYMSTAQWGPKQIGLLARMTEAGQDKVCLYSLAHNLYNSAWQQIPGLTNIISDPVMVSWGPGRLDIFAQHENGVILHAWWHE